MNGCVRRFHSHSDMMIDDETHFTFAVSSFLTLSPSEAVKLMSQMWRARGMGGDWRRFGR